MAPIPPTYIEIIPLDLNMFFCYSACVTWYEKIGLMCTCKLTTF